MSIIFRWTNEMNIPGGTSMPILSSQEKQDIENRISDKLKKSGLIDKIHGVIEIDRMANNSLRPRLILDQKDGDLIDKFLDLFS